MFNLCGGESLVDVQGFFYKSVFKGVLVDIWISDIVGIEIIGSVFKFGFEWDVVQLFQLFINMGYKYLNFFIQGSGGSGLFVGVCQYGDV